MSKKYIFLSIFSKITIFACVFCTISAWADTTTCDIDFTPVTGNSWQNGTPTPTNPVAIESVGTKVGNKYAVQVAVNYVGGVVDLGTLNWGYNSNNNSNKIFLANISDIIHTSASSNAKLYVSGYQYLSPYTIWHNPNDYNFSVSTTEGISSIPGIMIRNFDYTDVASFKQSLSGVMLYYQRATDETWTAPTLKTVYLDEPLRKLGDYADVLDYKTGTITRNVGVKVLDGVTDGLKFTKVSSLSTFYYSPVVQNGMIQNMPVLCTHFEHRNAVINYVCYAGTNNITFHHSFSTLTEANNWLASEYAAGTPVTVYYPLATPVVEQIENWSCGSITDIQIATTKMVDDEFAQAEANLAATVQTIESVVSRTIAQTGQIQVLQDTKQTRPDESCPANMKCLLVQDEDGTPHWYPIIEP